MTALPEFAGSSVASDWGSSESPATTPLLSFDASLSVVLPGEARSDSRSSAGADVEPSEAMLMRVVVALAGRDLVDPHTRLVSWREGCRCCFGESSCGVDTDAAMDELGLAIEMLSRATSVTGAAFDGQTLEYHFHTNQLQNYRFPDNFHLEKEVDHTGKRPNLLGSLSNWTVRRSGRSQAIGG